MYKLLYIDEDIEQIENFQNYIDDTNTNNIFDVITQLPFGELEEIIEKMSLLKSSGVRFSLDDFGTGYSSLAYLKRMPLDELKIDQGFVRDVLTDTNDAAIAKMVVVLADSMGIDVMAEGVETEPQREFLATLGCGAYQGYLLSRPLPIELFETFVNQRTEVQGRDKAVA